MQIMHNFKILTLSINLFATVFFQSSVGTGIVGTCLFPGLCNMGELSVLPLNLPLIQNSGCFVACQAVCGVGSGGFCRTWEKDFEFMGANLTAHPTHATCTCFNLLSLISGQIPPDAACPLPASPLTPTLADVAHQIFPTLWCTSCGATGTTNCYYQKEKHRFICDCVYDGYRDCVNNSTRLSIPDFSRN